jgi:hypothetical protein
MEKMLSPSQQLWLDLGRLVHDQVPDSDGHTLPPDTMVDGKLAGRVTTADDPQASQRSQSSRFLQFTRSSPGMQTKTDTSKFRGVSRGSTSLVSDCWLRLEARSGSLASTIPACAREKRLR